MPSMNEDSNSSTGLSDFSGSALVVQSRSDPKIFRIRNRNPDTASQSDLDLTAIWHSPVEKTANTSSYPTVQQKAIEALQGSTGVQDIDHLTADFTSVWGPNSTWAREQGPFYPLIDAFDFSAGQVENSLLIGRDPQDGRARFLLSDAVDANGVQHILVGNTEEDKGDERRDLIYGICLMAARTLLPDPDSGVTNNTFTIVDPAGLSNPNASTWRTENVDLPEHDRAMIAARDTTARLVGHWWGVTTADDERNQIMSEVVQRQIKVLSTEEFMATPQGRKVTEHLEGDGDISRYATVGQ